MILIIYKLLKMINVYIDGSCRNNGKKNAISGYGVYFSEDDSRNESKKIEGDKHTNNIAELTAFIRCLEILKDNIENNEQINIYTDSEYVIKCASSYGEKLYRNNWKTSDDKIPPNLELLKKAYKLYKNVYNIKLNHIYAHTNKDDKHSIGNKEADKLANLSLGLEKCPYEKTFITISYNNKDEAKKLGAKWDLNKKSWYYDDKISEENKERIILLEKNKVNESVIDIKKNYINIPFSKKNLAKTYGARWDLNKKSWYYDDNTSIENKNKLNLLEKNKL